ncbi:hypothetical protein ACUXKH_000838 [Staphylococcus epidermidis]
MYILFEHVEGYENPQVKIITINNNVNEIMKFLSNKTIKQTLLFENKQIFYCEGKSYILMIKEVNDFYIQEVTM